MKTESWRLYVLTALCLLVPGIFAFWPFVFGNALLLYTDIGSDSLNGFYSSFVQLSNYVRSDGFPSWSFHIGMGQDMASFSYFLLLEPVSWLPARFIAHALVYQHLLKVVIAGLIFFRFLQLRSLPNGVALLGALLLGYSGYMCMGSCCPLFVEELLAFSLILLGIERVFQTGRWLLLAVSVAIVGTINPFYLYLAAVFLACYFFANLFARNAWHPRKILIGSAVFGGAALLGVALGAIVTLPYLNVVLNSPRGAGATNSNATLASLPIFGLESPTYYATAFLRLFANDMVGTGDAFRGWQTYVEAPLTYCGLICLLFLPQVFIGATRRQRILYIAFLAWVVIPTLFPWFRYALWLFKGDYYRAYSLFSVFGIITLSMVALTRYLERGSLNVWLLGSTFIGLVGTLYLPIGALQTLIEPRLRIIVPLYLAAYVLLLIIGHLAKRQTAAAYLILVITVGELSHFGRTTVADRPTVQKQDLHNGMAAPAGLVDAIQNLTLDSDRFFRITEIHFSAGGGSATESNYPMRLGYYSTSDYNSFNDLNYISFLDAVGMLRSRLEVDTRWTIGLTGNFLLSLFAGEKYVLTQDPGSFLAAPQYEFVRSYGDYSLLRNQFSLPLGLIFHQYLPQDQFLQLPQENKEQVLLTTAVLDKDSERRLTGMRKTTVDQLQSDFGASSYPAIVEQRKANALQLTSFTQTRLAGKTRADQNGLLILQTPFNRGWQALQDGRPASIVKADIGLLGVVVDAGEHNLELRYRNPWLIPGAIISLCALLLLIFARWRWPRFPILRAA